MAQAFGLMKSSKQHRIYNIYKWSRIIQISLYSKLYFPLFTDFKWRSGSMMEELSVALFTSNNCFWLKWKDCKLVCISLKVYAKFFIYVFLLFFFFFIGIRNLNYCECKFSFMKLLRHRETPKTLTEITINQSLSYLKKGQCRDKWIQHWSLVIVHFNSWLTLSVYDW